MIITSTYLINYQAVNNIQSYEEQLKDFFGSEYTYYIGTPGQEDKKIPDNVYSFVASKEDDHTFTTIQWSNTQTYIKVDFKDNIVEQSVIDDMWKRDLNIFRFMQKMLRKDSSSTTSTSVEFTDQRSINPGEDEEHPFKATDYIKQQFPVPTVDNSYTDVMHAFHYTIKKQFQVGLEFVNVRDLYGDKGVRATVRVDDTMLAQIDKTYQSMADTAGIVLGMAKDMENGGLDNYLNSGRLPETIYDITASL